MRSRYSRGGGLSYSQQNFVEGFKASGGLRDIVQPIIPPPIVNTPIVEEEKVPVIETPIVEEKVTEVVETASPQPTSTPEPTPEVVEEVVPKVTPTPEPTETILRSIPTQKYTSKPIKTSNFKSKL
jgi:hypothetical protein